MLRRSLFWVGTAALLWIVVLLTVGGFDVTLFGLQIRSHNPRPIALVALLAWAGFFAAGGRIRIHPPSVWSGVVGAYDRVAARPAWIAAALAAATMAVSLAYSTRTAGASDIYGYMSQADLWLAGQLKIPQPWMAEVPWPEKVWSFSPYGYRPAPDGEWAIVPTYSPGLPVLLAGAKAVAGQCGLFFVVPLCGAIAVFGTYVLGRKLGSAAIGVIAAALLAASPAALGVMMDPLSDVPAMAVWTLALIALLNRGWLAALLSRTALVARDSDPAQSRRPRRPHGRLVSHSRSPERGARSQPWRWRWPRRRDAAMFSLGVVPGVLAIALLNNLLFGSPLTSGTGGSTS